MPACLIDKWQCLSREILAPAASATCLPVNSAGSLATAPARAAMTLLAATFLHHPPFCLPILAREFMAFAAFLPERLERKTHTQTHRRTCILRQEAESGCECDAHSRCRRKIQAEASCHDSSGCGLSPRSDWIDGCHEGFYAIKLAQVGQLCMLWTGRHRCL